MYLLGFDVGSSSVKVSVLDGINGKCVASAFYPKQEMEISARQAGWAEQEPEMWWENLKKATQEIFANSSLRAEDIGAIGISYQMHGLVAIDQYRNVLRPSIIWCDSRAVEIGNQAFEKMGKEQTLSHLLNSPGNFTASKLAWVKANEPEIFEQIDKIMLPGDYIAMKLTGKITTTVSGLSEGIFWDFKENQVSGSLLEQYGFSEHLIPEIVPTFSVHGELSSEAAAELGLKAGTKIAYRAGDQPNNAFSLNVLKPGEIAATAGTSGVVYGVSQEVKYDPESRVNTFAHVNYSQEIKRLGVLLCVNGTGILNSWLKRNVASPQSDYAQMNELAGSAPIGAQGLSVLPFGNGAERMLNNKDLGAQFAGLNFNIHKKAHLLRAAQEGIVFSFKYGMDLMQGIGIEPNVIRAGNANMFLSEIFRDTLASVTGATIELYDTDGAQGAARGAGVGAGFYSSFAQAFEPLKKIKVIEPNTEQAPQYHDAYQKWLQSLEKYLT